MHAPKARHIAGGVVAAALLVVAVEPAAAQSVNKDLISGLNHQLLYVAAPLAILVETILFYAIWRHKDNDNPSPTKENRSLEITWTIATAIILIFVGVASYNVMASPYISPGLSQNAPQSGPTQGAIQPTNPDATVVNVTAYQWGWDFSYPGEGVTSNNVTYVPTNSSIYFHLTSRDVVHAFDSHELGLKQDIFPHRYTTIRTRITEPGTYKVYSSEFDGPGNSHMIAHIHAVSPQRYQQWLDQHRNGSASANATATANARGVHASG